LGWTGGVGDAEKLLNVVLKSIISGVLITILSRKGAENKDMGVV